MSMQPLTCDPFVFVLVHYGALRLRLQVHLLVNRHDGCRWFVDDHTRDGEGRASTVGRATCGARPCIKVCYCIIVLVWNACLLVMMCSVFEGVVK